MNSLNTQFVEPAELTGFVRGTIDALQDNDVLSTVLPPESVQNISVRFRVGETGLVDAEPDIGSLPGGKRRTVDLIPISRRIPVMESDAIIARVAGNDQYSALVYDAAAAAARSIYERVRSLRGTVLATGRATLNLSNYGMDEDFGRDPELTATLSNLATSGTGSLLDELAAFVEIYEEKNGGVRPERAFASSKIINAFTRHSDFAFSNAQQVTKRVTVADVNEILVDHNLPQLVRFNEATASGKILPEDRLIMVPSAERASELGSTAWGLTESAFKPEFFPSGQATPGPVAAVWTQPGTAGKTVADADSTVLPFLKNANLSAALKVI